MKKVLLGLILLFALFFSGCKELEMVPKPYGPIPSQKQIG
jgi:PBP1b-binding outer membrane lipoprotein LpoB